MSPTNGIVNPNDNLFIPKWINEEYFRDILTKDEPEFVSVKKFTPTAAIPPGENFTSAMLRIHMDLEMKDGSIKYKTYIFKTMLEDDNGGELLKELALFPKELEMYRTFLPAFEQLYEAVGWHLQLAPKCLYTEKNGQRINFVFEDLATRSFKNLDRLQGFDMTHTTIILRKLAEFHAASAVYEEEHGAYPEDFHYGFVDPRQGAGFLKGLYAVKSPSYKKAMAEWGLANTEEYIKKFPTVEQFWKCGLATLQEDPHSFNVLTHGDFWSSNIMFSHLASGEPDEILLVDYQLCKWGSPAMDLLFFIMTSPAADIRLKEFDNFVSIYHGRLVECLKVLAYKKPMPTLRGIHMDMHDKRNTFYAFFACFNHLPATMLPSDKDTSLQTFARADEVGERFRMRAFTNPRLVAAMRDIFPFFHQRGIFNFEDYD